MRSHTDTVRAAELPPTTANITMTTMAMTPVTAINRLFILAFMTLLAVCAPPFDP